MVNLASFWKPKTCGQTVLPDRTKIGGKCHNWKDQMRHFGWFLNTVSYWGGGKMALYAHYLIPFVL